jgi:large subunit ribosomal protein L18
MFYAQVIDDTKGLTLAAASSLDAEIKTAADGKKEGRSIQTGRCSGLPNGLRKKGVTMVAFDRGGFRYHGRVKALAEAVREQGLKF